MDEGATLNCILSKEEINALLRPETMADVAVSSSEISEMEKKFSSFFQSLLRCRKITVSIQPIQKEEEGDFFVLGRGRMMILPSRFLYVCLERSLGGKAMPLNYPNKEPSRMDTSFFKKTAAQIAHIMEIDGALSHKEYISLQSDSFRVSIKMGDENIFFYMVLSDTQKGKINA